MFVAKVTPDICYTGRGETHAVLANIRANINVLPFPGVTGNSCSTEIPLDERGFCRRSIALFGNCSVMKRLLRCRAINIFLVVADCQLLLLSSGFGKGGVGEVVRGDTGALSLLHNTNPNCAY